MTLLTGAPARARSGLRAVIFDIDGTLAETEREGHLPAFNLAFRDHDLPYRWTTREYGRLLRTTGGRDRLRRYLLAQGHAEVEELADSLHRAKTAHFLAWMAGRRVRLRPGVDELVGELREAGVQLAVATCGSRAWVEPFLGRFFPDTFSVVVAGDDVRRRKPDPEPYRTVLARLALEPADALAVEDSLTGLEAARGAGLRCLVVTSAYTRLQRFPTASAVLPGYLAMDQFDTPGRPYLTAGITADALARLHADPLTS
jgi:HAD superfamily hydrolase (TIGR01509 family)